MNDNPIAMIREALPRHYDNPGIQALAEKLSVTITLERARRQQAAATYDGYRQGVDGEIGFGLMNAPDMAPISDMVRQMDLIREIAVIADCLIAVLNAHGESIVH